MTGGSAQQILEFAQIEQSELFGALEDSLQLLRGHGRGDIEGSSCNGRDRDALLQDAIALSQGPRVVKSNRWPGPTAGRCRYGGRKRGPGRDAPEPGGGTVAQQRAWPAGEHRGKALRLPREADVADRVNAAMEVVQSPVRRGSAYGAA